MIVFAVWRLWEYKRTDYRYQLPVQINWFNLWLGQQHLFFCTWKKLLCRKIRILPSTFTVQALFWEPAYLLHPLKCRAFSCVTPFIFNQDLRHCTCERYLASVRWNRKCRKHQLLCEIDVSSLFLIELLQACSLMTFSVFLWVFQSLPSHCCFPIAVGDPFINLSALFFPSSCLFGAD